MCFLPAIGIVSCSDNKYLQREANKIYSEVYSQFEKNNNYGNDKFYPESIYNLNTFVNFTNANSVKNITSDKFNVFLTDFDYENSDKGELRFKLILIDKNGNAFLPKPDDNEYFTNILSMKGFKFVGNNLKNKITNVYKLLNNKDDKNQFTLNKKGRDWVNKHKNNLDDNIYFDLDKKNDPNYFLNFIKIPEIVTQSDLSIYQFNVNILNTKPINMENDKVIFKFFVTLSEKNNSDVPFSMQFGFIPETNSLKVIEHIIS